MLQLQDQAAYTEADKKRLSPHNQAMLAFMSDGNWRSLAEISEVLGIENQGTCASRLRDIKAWGVWTYTRRRLKNVHYYRLVKVMPEQLPLVEI